MAPGRPCALINLPLLDAWDLQVVAVRLGANAANPFELAPEQPGGGGGGLPVVRVNATVSMKR